MIVAFNQLAGLGIRGRVVRYATWVGTSALAAGLAAASVAAAMVPYLALGAFAVWRLTGRPS